MRGYIELVAETRWKLKQDERGLVIMQGGDGQTATWRWTSKEGVVETMELVGQE